MIRMLYLSNNVFKTQTLWVKLGLSINVLCVDSKLSMQRVFFKNSMGNLLPVLRFPGGLYNFCIFIIIFSVAIISRRAIFFTDSKMIKYYLKISS